MGLYTTYSYYSPTVPAITFPCTPHSIPNPNIIHPAKITTTAPATNNHLTYGLFSGRGDLRTLSFCLRVKPAPAVVVVSFSNFKVSQSRSTSYSSLRGATCANLAAGSHL